MSPALNDLASYSAFIYSLAERHPHITECALQLAPIGATLARLEGKIECQGQLRIEVFELIDLVQHRFRTYSYEIYRGAEKICWYDPWEHPEIPSLSSTFPHHKHVPPDLRNHRVPAPGISFAAPNLDVILAEMLSPAP